MQKHNEWLSNRGYIQHLQVLKKINNRKVQSIRKTQLRTQERNTIHPTCIFDQNSQRKTQDQFYSNGFARSKEHTIIRDQQILWDNYHLGKRIIQTSPVISKRKLDNQYKKHKRLVQCITASHNRIAVTTDFRVKKLLEYKQDVQHYTEDKAIQSAHRNFIKITIINLIFYRQKPILDRLYMQFSFMNKQQKTFKQNTESFPINQLFDRHSYFKIPRRLVENQQALTIQLRNFKGLAEISVGYFSFPSYEILSNYRAQLFHCGKPIGQIEMNTEYGKRKPLIKSVNDSNKFS